MIHEAREDYFLSNYYGWFSGTFSSKKIELDDQTCTYISLTRGVTTVFCFSSLSDFLFLSLLSTHQAVGLGVTAMEFRREL